jgi:hypothetical protein
MSRAHPDPLIFQANCLTLKLSTVHNIFLMPYPPVVQLFREQTQTVATIIPSRTE